MALLKSVSKSAATKAKSAANSAEARFREAREASIMLKHVSDPTRLQLILLLSQAEQHVGELCVQLEQSQPAVSHHLALMRHGSVITPRRVGKNNYYSLTKMGEDLAEVVKNLLG